jgi:hypothetical protein
MYRAEIRLPKIVHPRQEANKMVRFVVVLVKITSLAGEDALSAIVFCGAQKGLKIAV